MEYLSEKGVLWAIAVDKDRAVKAAIEAIQEAEWKPFTTRDGNHTDREIAETIHILQGKAKGSSGGSLKMGRETWGTAL